MAEDETGLEGEMATEPPTMLSLSQLLLLFVLRLLLLLLLDWTQLLRAIL